MTRFAVRTLFCDRGKFLIAIVGVVFSFVLVNIQGGLFLGLIQKASLLVDMSDADIWVGRRGVENVDFGHDVPVRWLNRIRGLNEVARAEPYIVSFAVMTMANGGYENVWVVGSEPGTQIGHGWVFAVGGPLDLNRPEAVSIDELDAWKLGFPKVGDVVEINGQRAEVVAMTSGALGFLVSPYVLTNIDTAREYCRIPDDYCSYYLVQKSPHVSLRQARRAIQDLVPEADVYTADELGRKSRRYWMIRTGIGISFGGATCLGLIVGLVMVGQSLYALTLDHLGEYATLKALGADDAQIYRIVTVQSIVIGLLGTICGTACSILIKFLFETPVAPIHIPVWLYLSSVFINLVLCLLASVLPFRRIRGIDPAAILQGWA